MFRRSNYWGVISKKMKIEALVESELLSFIYDDNNLYIEFKVLLDTDIYVKLFAHNKDTNPILVKYQGLDINANLRTLNKFKIRY